MGCEQIAIEGYSMGSKGKVFHIAENTGVLKYKIYNPRWEHDHPRLLEGDAGSSWINRSEVKRKYDFDYPAILTPNSLRNVEEEVDLVPLKRRRSSE